ncbi:MAG: NADH-quinone oxidoreductase subunit N, partial [Acidimicrobiales bacterium]|nr:NADH-quinone oxidoreductase subunit N [Acidimicrobiales bacterium]
LPVDPSPIETPTVDWAAEAPLLILVVGALALMLISAFVRSRRSTVPYTALTCLIALGAIGSVVPLWREVQDPDRGPFSTLAGAVGVDGFSLFVTVVLAVAVILSALLIDDYLRRESLEGVEPYVLLLLSAAGGVVMAQANDLIVLFIGLEILSLAVYILAAMHRRRLTSQEAGIKYFVLGAFSSAFFLYGIALVYGGTGTTNMVEILDLFSTTLLVKDGLVLAGLALMLVGLGFKVAAVPFHFWTPDVYDGAPTPMVAWMASGVKVAGFAGLIRVFVLAFPAYAVDWQPMVYVLAVLTMLVGAVLAVVQTNVKRMMAYSSINHARFVLVGVQVATDQGVEAALFYLASYTFLVAGTFGVITLVGRTGDGRHSLDDYRGLSRVRPGLALLMTVFLLSQAGVPLTSGFFAKFYVITAAVDGGSTSLAVIAMLSSVISAFLYLRITVSLYMSDGEDEAPSAPRVRIPVGAGIALGLCVVATFLFGVWPGAIAEAARDAVPVLTAFG